MDRLLPVARGAGLPAQYPRLAGMAADYTLVTFKRIQLTDQFWCEGACYGDFNHDGKMDIVSGPFWYAGPDFKVRREYYPATASWKLKKAGGKPDSHASTGSTEASGQRMTGLCLTGMRG